MIGAILSILTTVTLLIYGCYKLNFMLKRDGASILQTVNQKHYTQHDEFTGAQGFMLAVSLDYPLPLEAGKLEVYENDWDWSGSE